jgi:hypothetical protein
MSSDGGFEGELERAFDEEDPGAESSLTVRLSGTTASLREAVERSGFADALAGLDGTDDDVRLAVELTPGWQNPGVDDDDDLRGARGKPGHGDVGVENEGVDDDE